MIELALLFRILRFVNRVVEARRRVAGLPAALPDRVRHRAALPEHGAYIERWAPIELTYREDVSPPARRAA